MNGNPFDVSVEPQTLGEAETRQIIEANESVDAMHTRGWVRMQLPADGEEAISFGARVLDGDYDQFPYAISAGRMITGPGETVAGIGLFNLLGLEVGDDLTVTVDERPLTLRLVGRVIENDDDGEIAFVDAGTFTWDLPEAAPSEYLLLLESGADDEAVMTELVLASNYDFEIWSTDQEPPEEATVIRSVMLGLSAVLLLIGLVNLFATTLLNVRERMRDFAIVKSIGMTPRQVTTSVIAGVSVQALIAVALGIPLGVWLYGVIFREVAEAEMGADPLLYTRPEWWWLVLLVPASIFVAALASALPARRATHAAPAELLRYE
jgi:putative ABC transport system permease protein